MARLPEPLHSHFLAPRGVGSTAGADGRAVGRNLACGDELETAVWLRDGRVERVAWRARGCSALLACASYAAERLPGQPTASALAFELASEVAAMGGLGPTQGHAVQIVSRAWREALSKAAESCQS
ncbi:MAG: iron-sulfur cluster assembly scaffold protein [Planctomycetes bacterium]|nr:iron-sulfur cluster assembly scaffold protein [Planctomycetota bacterium]